MSTLRVSNIEAKSDVSSPSVHEKIKVTNSEGDVLVHIDGATSGISTVGINTTVKTFDVDSNQNIDFVGNLTAPNITVTGTLSYDDVTNIDSVGIITARDGLQVTGGNVGINSTVPGEKLDVLGTIRASAGTNKYMHMYPVAGAGYFDVRNATSYPSIVFRQIGSGGIQERLRIDSAGSVGIGTDNPGAKTHIDSVTSNTPLVVEASQNNRSRIVFRNNVETGTECNIELFDDDLRFVTNSGERLRIDVNGNIGINSTTPHRQLVVGDGGDISCFGENGGIYFGTSTGGFRSNGAIARAQQAGYHVSTSQVGDLVMAPEADKALIFSSGSTNTMVERLRLTTGGNIGINDSGPNFHLDVNGSIALREGQVLTWHDGSGNKAGDVYMDSSDNFVIRNTSSVAERLRITSAGQMGLGTNDPNSYGGNVKLAVANTSGTCGLSIVSATNGDGNLYYADGTSGDATYRGYVRYNHTLDQFRIGVAGAERLRITSDGDVKIKSFGNASNSSADALQIGKTDNNYGITILSATNAQGRIDFTDTEDTNDPQGKIAYYHDTNSLQFFTNGGAASNERLRIDSSGRVTTPNQPCAMAYNAQGQHMAGNAVAQFNSTRFNIGSMYNSSNGRMTVPVDGRYLVAYSGLHDYVSQNAIGFDIRINGSNFDGGEGYQARNGTPISTSQLSKTLILSLSANDYVEIYIRQSGTQVHQRYGSFTMCLIT